MRFYRLVFEDEEGEPCSRMLTGRGSDIGDGIQNLQAGHVL
jgi:hypothetical protein